MSDVVLLQPDPASLTVSVHPNHTNGRRISAAFTDHTGTKYLLVFDPATTDYFSSLLKTSVDSPRVSALADQFEAEQRERQ